MTAIIIAAHNEEAVIGRCLDMIALGSTPADEIIVVANGCIDDTVGQAKSRRAHVIELALPGKAMALNTGDTAATRYPRLYLDADMTLSGADVHVMSETLRGNPTVVACAPTRAMQLAHRPLVVRAYFSIQQKLPVYQNGLVGRGAIMLSQRGRQRFNQFPDETADDLFLDALFTKQERAIVDTVTCVIEAPFTTRDLLRRLIRVRRGNIRLRATSLQATSSEGTAISVRASDRWSWLRDVVLRHPRLAPAGVVYAAVTLIADWQARRIDGQQAWGRDESTRRASNR